MTNYQGQFLIIVIIYEYQDYHTDPDIEPEYGSECQTQFSRFESVKQCCVINRVFGSS